MRRSVASLGVFAGISWSFYSGLIPNYVLLLFLCVFDPRLTYLGSCCNIYINIFLLVDVMTAVIQC